MKIENLSVKFGSRVIFKNYSADFGDEPLVFLWGKNGSGKTTLLKAMTGLEKNEDCKLIDVPEQTCFVPSIIQHFLLPWYSVKKNLLFFSGGLSSCRTTLFKNFTQFMSTFNQHKTSEILLDTKVHALSSGEKALIAMFCVEILKPQLVLFDETFANLNHSLDSQIVTWIKGLIEKDMKLLVCTHDYYFLKKNIDEAFDIEAAEFKKNEELI